MPSGYHIYLGTDNPPSNIVNGADLGNSYVYTPTLGLGQTYYWQIVPYNSIGSAAGCPVWSFSTLSPISTFPHSYGFEEEQYPPGGWYHTIISGATGMQRVSSSSQPGASPHTGSWMGWYNCRALSNGSSARLSSPPVQRTEDGYNYTVSFWMYRDSGYSTRADRVNVWAGNRDLQGATLLGTINLNVANTSAAILGAATSIHVPAASVLVMEVFTPDGTAAGASFFIGSNSLGQTAPSYLQAADCGITSPTPTGSIGFPNVHVLMSVNGTPGQAPSVLEVPTLSGTGLALLGALLGLSAAWLLRRREA